MAVSLFAFAFLLGSIPTAQIAAYLLAGVDLRELFPTVSSSGVYYVVARWAVIPVGLIDVGKGSMATYLPSYFGAGRGLAVVCGLAAVLGHNWSPWLGWRGGRGLSPFLGMLLVLYPWGVLLLLAALGAGRLFQQTPVAAFLGLLLLPAVLILTGGSVTLLRGSLAMVMITIAKRLEANRRPLPSDPRQRKEVLWRRFWYDRDEKWWPPRDEG